MEPRARGFSLIELMVTVAIVGVLAAVAIPAFLRYVRKAKTTEAVMNVKRMYDGGRSYYAEVSAGRGSFQGLARQFPMRAPGDECGMPEVYDCCSQPGEKCPATDYDSDRASAKGVWQALKFGVADASH